MDELYQKTSNDALQDLNTSAKQGLSETEPRLDSNLIREIIFGCGLSVERRIDVT
jgi:hypothetical protein